jgi:hypothetical protein
MAHRPDHAKHDRSEPVVIARPATEIEAAIMRGALDAEGIPSWVVGGLTAGFRAEAPGQAKLLVRAADAEQARAILARADARTDDDTDEVD